jgi:hypothetical protein
MLLDPNLLHMPSQASFPPDVIKGPVKRGRKERESPGGPESAHQIQGMNRLVRRMYSR